MPSRCPPRPNVPAFLIGYGERGWFGNRASYFSSFIRALKGERKPKGRLPVEVSDAYSIGNGISFDSTLDSRDKP